MQTLEQPQPSVAPTILPGDRVRVRYPRAHALNERVLEVVEPINIHTVRCKAGGGHFFVIPREHVQVDA